MNTPEKALAQRIRELRRRHFGPRGKGEFARRLGLTLEEYERFERGTLPPGDVMVRICELTGEDLQWLLTGVASRGTVVISGARSRHQKLLAEIVQALDERPGLAAPLEAFLDLLLRQAHDRPSATPRLPAPGLDELIPIFARAEWPDELPNPEDPAGGHLLPLKLSERTFAAAEQAVARLAEPAMEYDRDALGSVGLVTLADANGRTRRFVRSRAIARCFPMAFGVLQDDESMAPMFAPEDLLLTAVGVEPTIGKPALCKFRDHAADRCRIWLGEDSEHVHLGRAADGRHERMPRAQLRWSLEVLYRVAQAA